MVPDERTETTGDDPVGPQSSVGRGDIVPEPRSGRSGRIAGLVLGIALLAVVVAGVGFILFGDRGDERPGELYTITVPQGTGARIDAGELVELMPADLRLGINDTLVIDNQDVQTHLVGPFTVRPGETLNHKFTQAGVYTGVCSIHPSGEVKITVS